MAESQDERRNYSDGAGKMPSPSNPLPSDGRDKLFCASCAFLRPCTRFIPVLAFLLFFGALFWASEEDPYSRRWFTVSAEGHPVKCLTVLPKPVHRRPRPVIIYAHGSGGTLMNDGKDLRQMAELGLAVVSFEYDQTNEVAFASELESVSRYVAGQKWADTNAVAWVGFSLGAVRMFDFAQNHPEPLPQLLVQVSGRGGEPSSIFQSLSSAQSHPILLIHGDQDNVFPVADTKRLASKLQTNGLPVELKILAGLPHGLGPERGVVFRYIGEYCRTHLQNGSRRNEALTNRSAIDNPPPAVTLLRGRQSAIKLSLVTSAATNGWWQHYHSIAQRQAEAPSLVTYWLPAAVWAVGWFVWKRGQRPIPLKKRKPGRSEIALRWLAAILATWALAETSLRLLLPHFKVSARTLSIARRMLVQDKERADFEALTVLPVWQGQKLKTLLDHVELAVYNRELINWRLDDTINRDFVLSPVITGEDGEQPGWRRPLWEEFYPPIRRESSPEDAARIVVRHLRERVTVLAAPNLPHAVPDIWRRQLTDEAGFEIIYVAALRSIGVPARLGSSGEAELFVDGKWEPTPQPCIMSW